MSFFFFLFDSNLKELRKMTLKMGRYTPRFCTCSALFSGLGMGQGGGRNRGREGSALAYMPGTQSGLNLSTQFLICNMCVCAGQNRIEDLRPFPVQSSVILN